MDKILLIIEFKKRVDNVYCLCTGKMTIDCNDINNIDIAMKDIKKILKNTSVSIDFCISSGIDSDVKKYSVYTLSSTIYSVIKVNGVNNIDVIDDIDYRTAVKHTRNILKELFELVQ